MKTPSFLHKGHLDRLCVPVLLLLVTAALYGHTLQVPYYLDDNALFNGTFMLRDLVASTEHLFSQRGLTNLTFAINYRLTGWSLPALHLVNIVLHAGCGWLVWSLLRRLVPGRWPALLGALLFLAHPLQTQGVTYLAQRATVLGAFLFLLAFVLHLRSREVESLPEGERPVAFLAWHGAAVLAGAAAVLAKDNTATLPLVLFAYDRLFPRAATRDWRRALIAYLPFCLVPLLLGITALTQQAKIAEIGFSPYPLASLQHNSPLHYLVTQFSVFWVYLRLLLFPRGQALEHNYPVGAELLTLPNAAALFGLLGLGWLAWRARRRRPLLVFGLVWFFLALAVESSIIPLDPLFEHRLYLPMFGFVLVLLDGLPVVLGERRTLLVLALALLACLPLTWRRNALWNDPVAFYEDNLRVVPFSERAMVDLAFRYRDAGQLGQHLRLLEEALRQYPNNHDFYILLAEMHAERGSFDEALALLDRGLALMPDNLKLYENAALVAERAGRRELIFAYLHKGLASNTVSKWRLLNDLGIYYGLYGDPDRAEQAYRQSIELHPDNPVAYQYLGALYFAQRRWPEAFAVLRLANEIEPGNPKTLEGLGKAALKLGDHDRVRRVARKLDAVDPEAGRQFRAVVAGEDWP